MMIEYYVPERMLKRRAKQIARSGEMGHVSALNKIAFQHGFKDWKHLKLEGEYVPIEGNQWGDSLGA